MNDNIDNFDLQVREMLQDASVKAPKSVWKAVCRRISSDGSAPATFFGKPVWTVAVAGLSFAAAICAGLFFSRTGADAIISGADMLAAVSSPMEVSTETAPSGTEQASGVPTGTETAPSGTEQASGVPTGTETAPSGTEQASGVPTGTETAPSGTEQASGVPTGTTDPFALMELQDRLAASRTRRPSLSVSGNLSSNSEFSAATSLMGTGGEGSGALVKTGLESFGIPLQIGVGVRIPLTKNLSLGTGLNYTFLSSAYDAEYKGCSGDVRHNMSYVGIPLDLFYNLVKFGKISVYAHTGGTAEYCISNKYRFWGNPETAVIKEPVKGLMFSAGAGLGMEFRVTKSVGIYLDPSFRYYFHCDHPTSIRTEKPQTFNFEAGLRFSL